MMDYPVVVYGNADLYAECFNAIAATLGSSAYSTLLRISILLAGCTMMVSFIAKRDVMLLMKWFGIFYLVVFMLFMPKVTIHVLDRTNNGSNHPVDNMPLGLGVIASYTSLMGDALTQFLDETFSLPDDIRYTRSGMVMASRLVMAANDFQITDAEFNNDIQDFMQQCVFYDFLLRKYTINDLMHADNAWEFIRANTSKARAFSYNGNVTLCQEGAMTLSARWATMINQVAVQYGMRLFPQSKTPEKELKSKLRSSYQYLLNNLSMSSATIFSQHLMKNMLERSVIRMDGALDANAALQTFAYTRGMDQLRATFFSVGDLVGSWIQYFKNAIEIITYALFIFVVLLSVFPFGMRVLKNYCLTLMWLQCWAPIYAIINLIISFYAKANNASSNGSLTLETILAVSQANVDMTGLAGYLTILVPMISWGMVKGMESTFSHINHSFGGLMQSAVGSGVAETTTGNFSFANTNIGNHSTANNSGFHWDTSGRFSSGMLQTQLASGAMMMNTSDGHAMTDVRPTISNLGANVEYSGSVRKGLSKLAESSTTAAFNQSKASSENYSASMRDFYELGSHLGMTEGSSASWTLNINAGTAESYRQAMQLTDRFAHDHKISFGQAAKVLSSAYANISAGIGSNGIGVSASGRRGADHSSSYDNAHLYDAAESFVKDSGYSNHIDVVERAARDKQFRTNNEAGNRLVDNMGASYDRAQGLRTESMSNLQKAESYRQTANEASENAMSYRMTMDQKLAEYIASQPHPDGSGAITMARLSDITSNPEVMRRYVDRFVQANLQDFMPTKSHHGVPNSQQAVERVFNQNNRHIGNMNTIQDRYDQDKQLIADQAAKKEMLSHSVDRSTRQQVDADIIKHRNTVHDHREETTQQGQHIQEKHQEEAGRKRHGYLLKDAWNGIDTKESV